MSMTELKLDLPPNLSGDKAKLLLAVKLYEVGKASLGQASKLSWLFQAGVHRYSGAPWRSCPELLC